jgi:micrococcal nuclease
MDLGHRHLIVLAAAWLAACASPPPPCPACEACAPCPTCPTSVEKPSDAQTWFVLRVIDGDTLVARLEGSAIERKETVRLLNVNTPEKDEPGFEEAGEALKALVRGGTIALEFAQPNVEKRDGFGRLLAFVLAEGANANVEMVRQGWSKLYTKYGKGRLHAQFVAAESEARAAKRGLWGMP